MLSKNNKMFSKVVSFVLGFVSLLVFSQKSNYQVVSKNPATHFTESLPLGNGRLGTMVFGKTDKERIALNEISLWSGGKQDADLDSAYVYLKPIQNFLLEGKNKEAQDLLMKNFIAKGAGSGHGNGANVKYGCYQTVGDFFIDWQNAKKEEKITNYSNVLDIENAIATTTYERNGILTKQEVFTDYKNDIIWIKLSSAKVLGNFTLSFDRKENITEKKAFGNQMIMKGQLPSGKDKGMRFLASAKVVKHNGKLSVKGSELEINGASECVIAINIITDYNNENGELIPSLDLQREIDKSFTKIQKTNFKSAFNQSAKAYQSYFKRSEIQLNKTLKEEHLGDTKQRLLAFAEGKQDASLVELYFNFGKYLLISSSREGLLPSNLQGLWAEEYQTPWNGDYHLNINIQMNYWPAEVVNLSDLAEPLFRFTKNLVPNGEITAKKYYNANGWVAHVISNPWFYTSPGEGASWGSTLTGGAWLSTHIWEHYRFTKDKNFLREYYPVLKGSAEFLKNILIEEPQNKWLVTAPSNSPENAYIMPNGFRGYTCMGPTMDMQICRNIFSAVIEASEVLDMDKTFADELKIITKRLAPNQISPTDGGVQEWLSDWKSIEPQHRHVSHLFGLYPYDEINKEDTPELFEASKKTLEMRGDGGTGWSKAWKINFWARLQDGDHAFKMLKELLTPVYAGKSSAGGTYPNLFDAHPPFQIDGNFGATSGIAEMLLQSHGKDEIIRLLPALPQNEIFRKGNARGLVARKNFEVSFVWDNFKVKSVEILSKNGEDLKLEIPKGAKISNGKYEVKNNILNIRTKKGEKVKLNFTMNN